MMEAAYGLFLLMLTTVQTFYVIGVKEIILAPLMEDTLYTNGIFLLMFFVVAVAVHFAMMWVGVLVGIFMHLSPVFL